ncbi:hypothetical protein HDU76_013701 [Blyttiomyces sp. JEL0837]|nr:hypothetical protein HDU76_013701 [Blyttiomyces sp. JEL0837]
MDTSKVKMIDDDLFPKGETSHLKVCENTLAMSSDSKSISIWSLETFERLSVRETLKRPNAMLFVDQNTLFIADKFGDVYSFDLKEGGDHGRLLLGHVSILSDMAFSTDKKFLITADRDEKLRVSCFPHTYDIHGFCLGHESYISKIAVLPLQSDVVVSGGGDPYLYIWDISSLNLILRIDLRTILDAAGVKHPSDWTVTSLKASSNRPILTLLLDEVPQYELAPNDKLLAPINTITTDSVASVPDYNLQYSQMRKPDEAEMHRRKKARVAAKPKSETETPET